MMIVFFFGKEPVDSINLDEFRFIQLRKKRSKNDLILNKLEKLFTRETEENDKEGERDGKE
jgi:hypothetical protein